MKKGSRRKGRELAIQALYQIDKTNQTIEQLESLGWITGKYPAKESIAFFKELFSGTLKKIESVDLYIKEFAVKYDFNKIKPIDKAILRISVYELLCEIKTPCVIIINEGIELAKKFGGKDAYKFINGVLDGIRRKLVEKGKRSLKE